MHGFQAIVCFNSAIKKYSARNNDLRKHEKRPIERTIEEKNDGNDFLESSLRMVVSSFVWGPLRSGIQKKSCFIMLVATTH